MNRCYSVGPNTKAASEIDEQVDELTKRRCWVGSPSLYLIRICPFALQPSTFDMTVCAEKTEDRRGRNLGGLQVDGNQQQRDRAPIACRRIAPKSTSCRAGAAPMSPEPAGSAWTLPESALNALPIAG